MAELHSITGIFFEAVPGASPFGGYFIRKNENERREINGQIADLWGISTIRGEMHPRLGLLTFRKSYDKCNNEQKFDYKFEFKNGIWHGEYRSPLTGYNGKSICKTHVCMRYIDTEQLDLSSKIQTPEEFAMEMVKGLIEKDLIRKVKKPKSKNG